MKRLIAASAVFFFAAANASSIPSEAAMPRRASTRAEQPQDPCALPKRLFGNTAEPTFKAVPPPHSVTPSDCPFYQPAWQEFLFATKPVGRGHQPNFVRFSSFQQIFAAPKGSAKKHGLAGGQILSLEPRTIEAANKPNQAHQDLLNIAALGNTTSRRAGSLEDTVQAAFGRKPGGALIDQHGHFIYYGINANPSLVHFLKRNKLIGPDVLSQLSKAPTFVSLSPAPKPTPSLVEYKSAWMIVDGPQSAPTYYVVRARVPVYTVTADGKLTPVLRKPSGEVETRKVWVALLALHVVFTLPGHPEMVWSTFEHVGLYGGKWVRDNAPEATANPSSSVSTTLKVVRTDYPLYKAGTAPADCNTFRDPAEQAAHWNVKTQSFTKGGLLQTSIYRLYPGSKVFGDSAKLGEDDDVNSTNANATDAFTDKKIKKLRRDRRQFYRLVGAIWMDKPAELALDVPIANPGISPTLPNGMSADDPDAIVAGEDGLGSTAMESFTENVAGNCFSCHDNQEVKIAGSRPLPPSNVNLSHLISKYVGTTAAHQ